MMRSALIAAAAVLLAGCETLSYYAQAVGGHLEIMAAAQPVARLVVDPQTPADLRRRLELTQRIREFATRELKLPDNGSYRSYAALPRPFVVWNVVAAPAFSLQPVKSCFPVAGCVSYRGFFTREDAEAHASALRAEGLDVYLYGVPAYSTLGRFDDPLLSTFIQYPEGELARLIFHELAHQVAYAKDDSTFNESFAVAVERAGLRRWLAGREADLKALADLEQRSEAFTARLEEIRGRLRSLYQARLEPEDMRRRKAAEMASLKAELARFPRLAAIEPNNAFLAARATYTQLVPQFEQLLAEEGGDLARFYERVKQLAANPTLRSSPGPWSAPSR
ncbi:MAG: aminopeptidase [Betaproteobacteria bacterium]|nr:aminopeptidase [Betaproteobacteria bacterium]